MSMAEATRISPKETKRKLDSGEAILVCAYESDEKYRNLQLKGAMSLNQFKAGLPRMPKGQEIVFYCA